MKITKFIIFLSIFIFYLFPTSAKALDTSIPQTDDEYYKKIFELNYKKSPIKINYNQGNSSIIFPDGFIIWEGEAARQKVFWDNGKEIPTDIHAASKTGRYQYDVTFQNSGHVKIDDWKNIDTQKLLKQLKEANKDRVADIEWLQKPYLDRNRNAVYYSFKVFWLDNYVNINSTILILGRRGYANISMTTNSTDSFSNKYLTDMTNMYSFNDEHKYTDWKTGDKVAAAGIGALLAGSMGIKALKPALWATILFFLKKFWFIIFAPFLFIGRLFSKKEKEATVIEAPAEIKVRRKKRS